MRFEDAVETMVVPQVWTPPRNSRHWYRCQHAYDSAAHGKQRGRHLESQHQTTCTCCTCAETLECAYRNHDTCRAKPFIPEALIDVLGLQYGHSDVGT